MTDVHAPTVRRRRCPHGDGLCRFWRSPHAAGAAGAAGADRLLPPWLPLPPAHWEQIRAALARAARGEAAVHLRSGDPDLARELAAAPLLATLHAAAGGACTAVLTAHPAGPHGVRIGALVALGCPTGACADRLLERFLATAWDVGYRTVRTHATRVAGWPYWTRRWGFRNADAAWDPAARAGWYADRDVYEYEPAALLGDGGDGDGDGDAAAERPAWRLSRLLDPAEPPAPAAAAPPRCAPTSRATARPSAWSRRRRTPWGRSTSSSPTTGSGSGLPSRR